VAVRGACEEGEYPEAKAGQLSFHMRAVLKSDASGQPRRTYAARHTYLVNDAGITQAINMYNTHKRLRN
jgi:hypothetical protein